MTTPVLLVEDDETFSAIVAGYLETEGYSVEVVTTGQEMLRRLASCSYHAVLLDLGLPDEDGLALLRKLVARSDIPVMVVTARVDEDTRLTALEIGAADILTKPLHPRELRYRVLNLLHRRGAPRATAYLEFGAWRVDVSCRTVEHLTQNRRCRLTPTEFDTLVFLLRGNGRAFSRAQILDAVSADTGPESDRAVDILVSRLRRKLEVAGDFGPRIETVRGVGYRIDRGNGHASAASSPAVDDAP